MASGALVIAAENQEPYTAQQQAARAGRLGEYARDVPKSCSCAWRWNARHVRHERTSHAAACPWHSNPVREET